MERSNIKECEVNLDSLRGGISILESQIKENNKAISENNLKLDELNENFNKIKRKKEVYCLTLKGRKEQAKKDEIAKKAGQYIEPSNSKRNKVQKMSLTDDQICCRITECAKEMAVLSKKIKDIKKNNNNLSFNNEQNEAGIENKNKQKNFYSEKLTDLNRTYRESLKQNRQQKQEEYKCNIKKAQKNLERFLDNGKNKSKCNENKLNSNNRIYR